MTLTRILLPPDFSFDGVVRSHGWYDLPPFSYDRPAATLQTWIEREGRAVEVSFRSRDGELQAQAQGLGKAALARIARRVFSLDVDLDRFARDVAHEPRLARALAQGRGRMLRAPTLFEDAVKMLLTTNCTWAATKGMVLRAIAELGAGGRAFPTAQAVAALPASTLKSKIRCGYRARALSLLARRVARGRLDLGFWERLESDAEEIRASILSEHGFGPYAAEGLLRILGRHDFLAIDSWVRQEYRRRYRGSRRTTDRAIARRYARYGAHKGLALWLDMTSHWHETPSLHA